MSDPISLREAEKKAFTTLHNDGLWDILIGSILLIFALAPGLSSRMGDFWSSVIFLPFWGVLYLLILWVRKTVVAPRLGSAQFSKGRNSRLRKLSLILVLVNALAMVLGILILVFGRTSGWLAPALFGLMLVVGFSLGAYWVDMNRLYVYGLLAGISPLAGEWLFRQNLASHHGYPLTFGITSGVIILVGIGMFIHMLIHNPLPTSEE